MVFTQSAVSGNEGKRNWALRGSSSEDGEKNISKYGEDYLMWKSNITVLYDWFTNHSNSWPSLSCRYYGFLSSFAVYYSFIMLNQVVC